MWFRYNVFEKLLFEIHEKVYQKINKELDDFNAENPGVLDEILSLFKMEFDSFTGKTGFMPGTDLGTYPNLDVIVTYDPNLNLKMSLLKKNLNFRVELRFKKTTGMKYEGSSLIVGYKRDDVFETYITPLPFLLGFAEKKVMSDHSYQLYQHNIIPNQVNDKIRELYDNGKNLEQVGYSAKEFALPKMYTYIGITKRTWQKRYLEHKNASLKGSYLLFHRALRGEYCGIGSFEHIIMKAGLSENQALELEEADVESQSLYPIHPHGLNMIPGGKAGLKLISSWAMRKKVQLKTVLTPDNAENVLVEIQEKCLRDLDDGNAKNHSNPKLAELWAKNIEFRIKATTNQNNRFSYKQIQTARILHSSGWTSEKILAAVTTIDEKNVSLEQIERLLAGKTYVDIPDIII